MRVTDVAVLVVGGGPAGLSAAMQARELGAKVTLLEAEQIGGTSLNRGPAPVRTLARAARLVRGSVGMTEREAALGHEIEIGIANYDDLLRPVADGRPDGFCKLVADRRDHSILGAHVLGEYSAETVRVVATAMSAGMRVEQLAEMQFAFPTFTEAVSMAAQKVCRKIGTGQFPPAWSYPGSPG